MCVGCAEKIIVDVAATTTNDTSKEAIWIYNDITQDMCNACRTSINAGMTYRITNMCMQCVSYLIDVQPVATSNPPYSELKEQTVREDYNSDSEPDHQLHYRSTTRMCLEETSDCDTYQNIVARTQSEHKEQNISTGTDSECEENVTRMCRRGICVSDDDE